MVAPYMKNKDSWYLVGEDTENNYTITDGLVSRMIVLEPIKKKELFIECECHGELLKINKFEDEEEYYLTVYRYSFPNISFFRRVEYALDVLRGKGIRTADLVLSKENFNKIKKFK